MSQTDFQSLGKISISTNTYFCGLWKGSAEFRNTRERVLVARSEGTSFVKANLDPQFALLKTAHNISTQLCIGYVTITIDNPIIGWMINSFAYARDKNKMSLSNKVIVVTGAASGMGRATALMLAEKGAHLGLLDLSIPDDLLSQLRLFGVQAVPLPCDVRASKAVDEAVRKVAETIGPIDGN